MVQYFLWFQASNGGLGKFPSLISGETAVQVFQQNIVGSLPDNVSKVNIAKKQVTQIIRFPSAYKFNTIPLSVKSAIASCLRKTNFIP